MRCQIKEPDFITNTPLCIALGVQDCLNKKSVQHVAVAGVESGPLLSECKKKNHVFFFLVLFEFFSVTVATPKGPGMPTVKIFENKVTQTFNAGYIVVCPSKCTFLPPSIPPPFPNSLPHPQFCIYLFNLPNISLFHESCITSSRYHARDF